MNESDFDKFSEITSLFQIERIFLLFLGIAILILVARFLAGVGNSANRRFPSKRLLVSQIVTSLNFMIYIFGGIFIFYAILRPPKELLIAVAGSLAVALGLSLKDLVASVVAGFILLFDRPFQVGDRVSFGDIYGEIKSIGLRAVRLVTLDDNLVTIPNSKFITDAVASGNFGALDMMVVCDFHLAIGADFAKARTLLKETVATSKYVYLKKPISIVASEAFVNGQLIVVLKVKAYVLDVRFEKAFQTDLFLRGISALGSHNIQRPQWAMPPL